MLPAPCHTCQRRPGDPASSEARQEDPAHVPVSPFSQAAGAVAAPVGATTEQQSGAPGLVTHQTDELPRVQASIPSRQVAMQLLCRPPQHPCARGPLACTMEEPVSMRCRWHTIGVGKYMRRQLMAAGRSGWKKVVCCTRQALAHGGKRHRTANGRRCHNPSSCPG